MMEYVSEALRPLLDKTIIEAGYVPYTMLNNTSAPDVLRGGSEISQYAPNLPITPFAAALGTTLFVAFLVHQSYHHNKIANEPDED